MAIYLAIYLAIDGIISLIVLLLLQSALTLYTPLDVYLSLLLDCLVSIGN